MRRKDRRRGTERNGMEWNGKEGKDGMEREWRNGMIVGE